MITQRHFYTVLTTVPPDTTTFALVNSGLSLTLSSSPTHADKSLLVSTDGAANEDAKAFDYFKIILSLVQ